MKMKKMLSILICHFICISSFLNAQIVPQIKQVGGREVKTKVWKDKDVKFIAKQIAVKIAPFTTTANINELLLVTGGKIIESFDGMGWGLIEIPDGKDELLTVDEIVKLPFIVYAEPEMIMSAFLEPDDPYFKGTSPATYSYQWALKNTAQTPPTGTNDADIDAPEAWNITTGSSDVIIAILDTGIPMLNGSLSHPDLDNSSKIILGPDYGDYPGSEEWIEGVRDRRGHGTHVAGIAAAESNNGAGIAGVAWNSKILVIQVFDENGIGTYGHFRSGVYYAVNYQRDNPGKKVIINFSGGGIDPGAEAHEAVVYANNWGVPIIASAGNYSEDPVCYPAAYSSSYSNVIAVTATDATDTFSSYFLSRFSS